MSKKSYSDLLKDPRWQQVRLKVFERDNWKCRHCNIDTAMLNAHHLYYQDNRDPWDYELRHIITLCDYCHKEEHSLSKYANKEVIRCINATGASWADKAAIIAFLDTLSFKDLPNDFWEVMAHSAVDLSIYEKTKKRLSNKRISSQHDKLYDKIEEHYMLIYESAN